MHSNISRDTIWRSGAVLNIDGNKVLVRADYDDRRITILVKGERKREALTTVRTIINSINRSVPGLVSVERVAIPKYPEADPMKYEDLLKLEQEDRISVPVVIDGQVVDIDVTEILNGIEAGEIRNVAGLSNQGVPFLQNAASDINLSQAEAIAPSNNTERSPGANQPGIARVIFSSIPKIFGEFVFDVFGRHNAALSSKLILGYILIFCGLLIIIGIINITDLVELFKYNWRFFNPEPSIIVP
jgi:hypothetical protein